MAAALPSSRLTPVSASELADSLREATQKGVIIGGVELDHLQRIISHVPEDMTVTVESGMKLAALQASLRAHGQWLPLDPPEPDLLSLEEVLSWDLSGPRRLGFASARDHVIGMKIALADGRIIRSGGQVVKNVAGYDLMKLFIGAHRSLGIIVEVSFKLLPLPEVEVFRSFACESLAAAEPMLQALMDSPLVPSVLDLHDLEGQGRPVVTIGFSGVQEDVQWQLDWLARYTHFEPSDLSYEERFWGPLERSDVARRSELPSTLVQVLAKNSFGPYIARAGNGVIFHRATTDQRPKAPPHPLALRIKQTYDPAGILPSLPS